ncbi:MAG TPA: hypothetical protein VNW50_11010 [Streptosporangiaceae bacterium]|jgi:hypothetical protein|nr:hypothetical protein [Streptosporangiaceae bacterium]
MSHTTGRPEAGSQAGQEQAREYAPGAQHAPVAERRGGGGAFAGAVLAGVLMILTGLYSFLAGLAMILRAPFFVYHGGYLYAWSTHGWGWVELILGAVVVAAGACVLLGMVWARAVGVILATLSAVASFMSLPFYPIWSIILIAVNLFIIWAMVAYSGRRSYV